MSAQAAHGEAQNASVTSSPLTRVGCAVGTPAYVPSEVWAGEPASPRSDVHALGAVLYEICTGFAPSAGVLLDDLPWFVQEHDIPPLSTVLPDVDPRFGAIIDRCLLRDPTKRFASRDELREALEQLAHEMTEHAIPEGNPYRGLAPFQAEHRALFFGRHRDSRAIRSSAMGRFHDAAHGPSCSLSPARTSSRRSQKRLPKARTCRKTSSPCGCEPSRTSSFVSCADAGAKPASFFRRQPGLAGLAELWNARNAVKASITAATLESIGGIAGTVARHADDVLLGMRPSQRAAAQKILTALVAVHAARLRRAETELVRTDPYAREALHARVCRRSQ